MLWRFSFASASTLDALFTRETPPSVEEVMDDQDILNECKAQNQKLVTYLSGDDTIRSLLQWVLSGLDELDQQAAIAEEDNLENLISPSFYPSYSPRPLAPAGLPGLGPGSPPLEPAKIASEDLDEEGAKADKDGKADEAGALQLGQGVGLGEGLERQQSQGEDSARSRYPQLAAEILTSELWTVTETIMSNKEQLLTPFWDAVLPPAEAADPETDMSASRHEANERERARDEFWSEEDEERDRKREMIRGMWVKVNGALLAKRTTEMIRFIQGLPNIVDRLMSRIGSPAVQDMLIRIVSSEEAGVAGVIEWLADEGLVPKLLALLSPCHSTATHGVASELLKSIITLCAPTPFNPAGGNAMEQQQPGSRDNRLIRELVGRDSIDTLVGFMLDDIALSDRDWKGLDKRDGSEEDNPANPFVVHPLPSIASATSSVSHICNILVELIRRNNSDFSEPHLFHTLRNRLMQSRQPPQPDADTPMAEQEEKERQHMEDVLEDLSQKMGIVHLGHLLTALADRFGELHALLLHPRGQDRAKSSALAKPLTLERFRIVELYAELLHSSNMSILNRATGSGPTYSADGILSGGLEGLEALGEAIDGDRPEGEGEDNNTEGEVTQAKELPVSSSSTDCSLTGSDADEAALEDVDDTPSHSPSASTLLQPHAADAHPPPPSQADVARLRDVMGIEPPSNGTGEVDSASHAAVLASTAAPSLASSDLRSTTSDFVEVDPPSDPARPAQPSFRDDKPLPPGDRLKQKYVEHRVLPTVVDLFFEYPNNDFLHHVVYDLLQQVLNGRLGFGLNRELVIELVREAKLVERILDAQRLNDRLVSRPRTPRLAYMGHIDLIAEELVKFFSRCPSDLYDIVSPSFNRSEWEAFVETSLRDARARDTKPLAGGKPMLGGAGQQSPDMGGRSEESSDSDSEGEDSGGVRLSRVGAGGGKARDDDDDDDDAVTGAMSFGEPLRRTEAKAGGFAPRDGSFDAGDRGDADDAEHDRFWRTAGAESSRRHVDSSDEDDDDADWLRPSAPGLQRGGSDDDEFGAFSGSGHGRSGGSGFEDLDDDDAWGTFENAPNRESPSENPFGDDNFVPSVIPAHRLHPANHPPQTPHDWALEFDREFTSSSFGGADEADAEDAGAGAGATAIVVPDLEEEEEEERVKVPNTPGSTWSFSGAEDESEDLPPTHSPVLPEAETLERLHLGSGSSSPQHIPHRNPASPSGPVPLRSPTSPELHATTHPIPVPGPSQHHHNHIRRESSGSSSSSSPNDHQAFSPPDPHLLAAATRDSPLGPGVSPNTHITEDGMLEKDLEGGGTVRVPADEVVRGVEDAMERREREREGQ